MRVYWCRDVEEERGNRARIFRSDESRCHYEARVCTNVTLGPIDSFHRRKFLSFRIRDYSVKSCAFLRIDWVRNLWEIVRSASRSDTDRAGRRKSVSSIFWRRALDQSTISTVSNAIPRIRFHAAFVEVSGLTMTDERIQPRINLISTECLLNPKRYNKTYILFFSYRLIR